MNNDIQLCLGIASRSVSETGHKCMLGNNSSINNKDKRNARLQSSRNYFLQYLSAFINDRRVIQVTPIRPPQPINTWDAPGTTIQPFHPFHLKSSAGGQPLCLLGHSNVFLMMQVTLEIDA